MTRQDGPESSPRTPVVVCSTFVYRSAAAKLLFDNNNLTDKRKYLGNLDRKIQINPIRPSVHTINSVKLALLKPISKKCPYFIRFFLMV